jgi:hypothetical protein
LITVNPTQVLSKPPRLMRDETGYDWREFDRWIQRLYLLLGTGDTSNAYNVINAHIDNSDGIAGLDATVNMSGVNHPTYADFQALAHAQTQYNPPGGDSEALKWM